MAYAKRKVRRSKFAAAQFTGMRDSLDASAAAPNKAFLIQNAYPLDANSGNGVVGRPGFTPLGDQLGAGGRTQGFHQFTKIDGTEYTIAIVGGKFYTYDWIDSEWDEVLTAGNLSGAGVILSSTATVAMLTFANTVVVSDGVNTPWTWDGTTNGGIVELTNAPVFYGRPTIYYGRLFAIKASDRSTIAWSEPNTPNTGWNMADYDNEWTLLQTDTNPLTAIVGTNAQLIVFRSHSITGLFGAPDVDFQGSATREGISETTGTTSPFAVTYVEKDVYFPDADGKPFILRGSGLIDVWKDWRVTLQGIPQEQLHKAWGVYHETCAMVLLGYQESDQTECNMFLVVNPDGHEHSPESAAVWRGFTYTALGFVKNDADTPIMLHGTDDGYVYMHGNPDGSLWNDELVTGEVGIEHIVQATALAYDPRVESKFTRVDFAFRTSSQMTGLSTWYDTPRGQSASQSLTSTGSLSYFDEAIFDTDVFTDGSIEGHKAVGLNGFGRWIRPAVSHQAVDEQFGIIGMTVEYQPQTDSPEVP